MVITKTVLNHAYDGRLAISLPQILHVDLPGGAVLRGRYTDAVIKAFEQHDAIFNNIWQNNVVNSEGRRVEPWAVTHSELETVNHGLGVKLESLIEEHLYSHPGGTTVLDWGCGNDAALTQLVTKFSGRPVTFYGFGDQAFREWLSAPKGNNFILDKEIFFRTILRLELLISCSVSTGSCT